MRKNQSGNVHLIIIIILIVLAIFGALGFVVWKNFFEPGTHLTSPISLEKSKTLSIPEFGIEGLYASDIDLLYQAKSGTNSFGSYGEMTGNFLLLYSSDTVIFGTPKIDVGCDNGIGSIERGDNDRFGKSYNSGTMNKDYFWHIGNYYYQYVAPQSYCKDENGEIMPNIQAAIDAMKNFFANAKTIE